MEFNRNGTTEKSGRCSTCSCTPVSRLACGNPMAAITSQSQHRYPSHSPASPHVVVITRRKYTPTTLVERLLLLLNILLLPLEAYGPTIGGFSSMFFLFAISGLYVVIWRFGSLAQIWGHR